jgi:hypothetical protein
VAVQVRVRYDELLVDDGTARLEEWVSLDAVAVQVRFVGGCQ